MTHAAQTTGVGTEHRGALETLARRGSASVLGAGFSAIFGILLVVVVTNGFTPTVAGTLFAATSAFLILESVALLGTDTGLVKWMPAQIASGRPQDLPRTLTVAIAPVLAFALVIGVGLYAVAPSVSGHLVGEDAADVMTTMLRVVAIIMPVASVYDQLVAATRGTGSMRPTVMVENIGRLGLQALAVLVAMLAGGGPLMLALAWSLPYAVGLVAVIVWLRKLVRARMRGATGVVTDWLVVAREFWAYTAPRAIARVTQTALKRSDIVLVAALASPAQAALYTAATRFIVLGQLFVQSVQQALSPQIAALFARDESRAANSVYQAATLWSMIAAWPLYLVLAGFSPTLMGIFGEQYDVATDVVLILALTMLLATACGPVDSVLLMAGHSWLSLRNSVVSLAVNVALNFILIPIYGIRGAAISWSVAIVVRNLQPLFQVRRHLSMWPLDRIHGVVALGAVACFGSVALVGGLTDFPVVIDLAMLTVASLIYLYGVWTWRDRLGLGAFRAALRRRGRSRQARLAARPS
ncbi:MAG TPA: polysaccharide biosynthesis protein [Nocardioides bacterium]|uniref:oligosaccharide flippase family protein n=1 Tax=uncultured Nocardioides sp. TaxID=198441 RepID=UPI000ECDC6A4|nr:oligosaccharide flippase family protein [uncultured Nocardioides sp.]HCB03035.1 polysaccharide biosynthesis protein [Nocardioides sp.]